MRKSFGQVALTLNLLIAVFIIGSLGFVAFEFSCILLARDQLKHDLEFAALAGGATMASTQLSGTAAQQEAVNAATNVLSMNSILGAQNQVTVVASPTQLDPGPQQVAVFYEFDDPLTKQPSPTGNVMHVYGAYTYQLFSGGFGTIGVKVCTVKAESTAGLPAMDLAIVYSNSSSLDDNTPVTLVRRYWDPTVPTITYYTPSPGGTPESGPISTITCPGLLGSGVNGLPPQNLDAAGDPNTSSCPVEFSETGPRGKTVPLRGVTNVDNPPGDAPPAAGGVGLAAMTAGPGNRVDTYAFNRQSPGRFLPSHLQPFDSRPLLSQSPSSKLWIPRSQASGAGEFWHRFSSKLGNKLSNLHLEQPAYAWYTGGGTNTGSGTYNPWNADPTMFTDLVVNLDGNNTFTTYTDNGVFSSFSFTDISYLVEASRGNMDDAGVAGPATHVGSNIANSSKIGYFEAYECLAYRQLQPKNAIEGAVVNFMTKVQQTCDCHFCFVAFNDRAGTSPNDVVTPPMVSWAYPVAGNTTCALPQIPLDPNSSNAGIIQNCLTPPNQIANQYLPWPAQSSGFSGGGGTPSGALFTPTGGSNLADGLQQAYQNLTGPNSRSGAFKAIVVVTDKVPDRDLAGNVYTTPAANGPALSDATDVAINCHNQGIPIFVVALDHVNGGMTPYFQSQFSDTAPGGLVYTAGNGGVLYVNNYEANSNPVNASGTQTALIGSFNNVVRQLMSLLQG